MAVQIYPVRWIYAFTQDFY